MYAHIVLFLGPIGFGKITVSSGKTTVSSGKSTTASGFSDERFVVIDGDDVDSRVDTMSLGQERSVYTRWRLIQAIMNGRIPVLSTGGGVLLGGFGIRDIRQHLESVFPETQIIITTFVAQDVDEVVSISAETYDSNFYRVFSDSTRTAVCDRVERGDWTIPPKFPNVRQFADFIAGRSITNGTKVVPKVLSLSDYVFAFPPVRNWETYDRSQCFQVFDEAHPGITQQPLAPHYTQCRCLIRFGERYYHITYDYTRQPREYVQVEMPSSPSFVRVQHEKNEFLVVSGFPIPHRDTETTTAHVTLQSGPLRPAQTLDLTIAYNLGRDTTLTDRNGSEYHFCFDNCVSTPVDAECVGFFIV
jgi:hypothetical protein